MPRPRTVIHELPKGPGADLAHVLATNVRSYRAAQGLTVKQLSAQSGFAPRTLARVEAPEGIADLNTLALLAKALKVHPSALIL